MNFYNIIYNLETICNLEKGDKLIIRDDILIISPKSMFRPIYRYINNHNREKINIFLIKLFLDLNIEIKKYENFVNSNNLPSNIILNIKSRKRYENVKSLISRVKLGIDNLKYTYNKDKYFVRKLQLFEEEFIHV